MQYYDCDWDGCHFEYEYGDWCKREDVEELIELLKRVLPIIEHTAPPKPNHICGPESCCDMDCSDWFHTCQLIDKIKGAIK